MWFEIHVIFLAFTLRTNFLLATNKANLCLFVAHTFSYVYVLNHHTHNNCISSLTATCFGCNCERSAGLS